MAQLERGANRLYGVERDRPAYGVRQNAQELRENLARGFRVRPEDAVG